MMLTELFDEMLDTLNRIHVSGEEDINRMQWLFKSVRALKGMVKIEKREIKEEEERENPDQ
jgi:hypothetical protein|nr:MAG TPA: hypothetical protein [Caudoviricetes sp.]